MAKTYSDYMAQIEKLKQQAEAARHKEIAGVVARIKEAIAHYGLTGGDLGLEGRAAAQRQAVKRAVGKKPAASAQPKFRDGQGNVWGGRGPRPQWLRDALASGRRLEDFAVGAAPSNADAPSVQASGKKARKKSSRAAIARAGNAARRRGPARTAGKKARKSAEAVGAEGAATSPEPGSPSEGASAA